MSRVSILTVLPQSALRSVAILGTLAVSLVLPELGQRGARNNARDSLHMSAYEALLSREASRGRREPPTAPELRPDAA